MATLSDRSRVVLLWARRDNPSRMNDWDRLRADFQDVILRHMEDIYTRFVSNVDPPPAAVV
jgi:hypothetical protein